ncbi:MAG: ROK family protein [Candidatus Manganitrophus sp. SB1]|nr:ROK family protein [Candidatus Manganitrophus morganii]
MDRLSTCVIGIDLGGTYIKGAALDLTGQILSEGKIATEVAQGQERVLNNVAGLIADLCKMSGGRSLAGVGLGVPGALDFKEGRIIESPNFPGWDNFPIRSRVEKAVGVPVVIENDASAAAMGERWVGAAQNVDNFLLITLGTGVGGGLVLGGKLWPGETGKAGEVGHMKITPDGPPCGCGSTGCLEVYASSTALVRMAQEEWRRVEGSAAPPAAWITSSGLADAAEQHHPIAEAVFRKMSYYLGIGIANVANLLDIHHFILSGGVSNAFHLFEEPLRQEVARRAFGMTPEEALKRIIIRRALLGESAGMIGAGHLVHLAAKNNGK